MSREMNTGGRSSTGGASGDLSRYADGGNGNRGRPVNREASRDTGSDFVRGADGGSADRTSKRDASSRAGRRPSSDGRRKLGMRGETVAADHLASIGYRIIERNWRCPVGELDLIAEDGGTLVFVEVRSRRDTGSFGTPEESVDARKQKRLRELARMYLYRGRAFDRKTRFDVVAVTFAPDGELLGLRHVKSAF